MKRETVFEILDQVDYEYARSEPPADFPNLPRIPAARHFDPDFFDLEMEAIRRCWVIVGTVHEWPENGSYKVVDRWGTASVIVVRGDDGDLRAFYNTCQHRGAPITRDECGRVNKLRCQWHSWQYALDGTLVNIPGRRDFHNDLDTDEVRLNTVGCQVWRGFVFVNLDPEAPDLVDWLGPVADQAVWFDGLRTAARSELVLNCNWKICIEANIEVYHVTTVHPTTVARGLDYRGSAHELYDTGHSRMIVPRLHYDAETTRKAAEEGDAFDALRDNSNVSFLLFPFHLTPSGNQGMTLQTFWPLAPDKTLLEWWTMVPDWGEGEPPDWTQGRNDYFDEVMAEDTESNEPVQRSLQAGAFPGILTSYHERRIYHHEAAVDRLIGIDKVPEELRVPQMLDHYIVDRPGYDREPDTISVNEDVSFKEDVSVKEDTESAEEDEVR